MIAQSSRTKYMYPTDLAGPADINNASEGKGYSSQSKDIN